MTTERPTVVLVGTLGTKGPEHAFVRDRLREAGVDVLAADVGSDTRAVAMLAANVNDPAFADLAAQTFLELWAARRPLPARRDT
jgi:uncharacterized protein (UPF0261 family)